MRLPFTVSRLLRFGSSPGRRIPPERRPYGTFPMMLIGACARLRLPSAVLVFAFSLCAFATSDIERARADEPNPGQGERIYKDRCLSCHGAKGEGSEEFPRQLAGNRSVDQLARLISKTMPQDEPGTCVGEDAKQVAAYIHDAFYSPIAQARIKPARIELSRLTVRQYRIAVADLLGGFRGDAPYWEVDGERGLKAEYFKSKNFGGGDRVITRVDPEVRFDFGDSSPDPAKIPPKEYAAKWQGSVIALETGIYEFVVRTPNGARLWVNDTRKPLIDAGVKSGNDTEFRQPIFLLGGRAYPIRLEVVKFNNEKQGSVALEWKPPGLAAQVIPRQNLLPSNVNRSYLIETPFPPDDRSIGYERGSSISKAWDQATTDAAIETVALVMENLRDLSGIGNLVKENEPRVREFCQRFVERAFRRPLTDEQKAIYIDRQFQEAGGNLDLAVKRVLLLALKSPRFLYREVGGSEGDPYDVASRISFGLWDSIPDKALLDAARAGRLKTKNEVAAQANRMLNDPRSRFKVRDFLMQWLRVQQTPDLSKDPKLFPEFTPEVAVDLRASLDLFLDDVVWSKGSDSDFRRLLLSDQIYLNGRLTKLYGGKLQFPENAPFQKAALDQGDRAGVLSHPYLMANFSYTATSSPIHRGVFVARSMLGRTLMPPPEAVAPLAPDLHPGLNTRERVTLQTRGTACQSCHDMINPLGFPFESYDAIGRFRAQEKEKPVDSTGSYLSRSGETVKFSGVRELGEFLAASEEAHEAFVEQLFHHLIKQPLPAYGPRTLTDLRESFVKNNFHVRKLIVDIIAASALTSQSKPNLAAR